MTYFRTFFLFLCFCCFSKFAYSQSSDWKFTGQMQMRTELDGRDFSNKTYPLSFTSMRTRLGVERIFNDKISAFVQLQDTRIWGEAKNTIFNTKNVDLHQGYIKATRLFGEPISIQAGRFKHVYRNGRVFGANDFNYNGRTWDGAKVSYTTKPFSIDLFTLTHSNSVNYIGNAVPDTTQYPFPSKHETGYNVYGLWSTLAFDKEHYLDLFGYYDWNRRRTAKNNYSVNRFLVGTQYKFTYNNFFTLLEAAYQGGEAGDQLNSDAAKIVQAYNIAASLNYKIDALTISLNADILSGSTTDELKEGKYNKTYETTFQGRHPFYGGSDYFSNIAKSTHNRGVNDFFMKFDYAPKSVPLSFMLELHQFMTNKPYLLQTGEENSMLGQELHFTMRYNFIGRSFLEWGSTLFLPDEVMKDVYDVNKTDGAGNYDRTDPAFWTYIMLRLAL